MARNLHMSLLSFLLLSSLLQGILCGKFVVIVSNPKTPGGHRFLTEIGARFTINIAEEINQFIWKLFKQNTPAQRKIVPVLNINITTLNGALGQTGLNNIYIDAKGLQGFPAGRARFYFTKLMYHEMTHIFQWSGRGTAPGGLTEGVADYVVMKSKYFEPQSYTKPGAGKKWDEGYGVTARFLEYCDTLSPEFTVNLNNKMTEVYKDEYFKDLLGKPLDQVWREYKAKYATN